MRRTVHLPLLLVVILASGIGSQLAKPVTGVAQEATPEASPDVFPGSVFPITPAPADCNVEPRSSESIAALLGPPVAGSAPSGSADLPEPFVAEIPVGQPADEEIAAGVTATVVEIYACLNANDLRRAFALHSDAFLQRYVAANALTADDIEMLLSEPGPIEPGAQATILAVTDVTLLDDGRIGAFVVTTSEWSGPDTGYLLFVQHGGRWLIDESIPFLAA